MPFSYDPSHAMIEDQPYQQQQLQFQQASNINIEQGDVSNYSMAELYKHVTEDCLKSKACYSCRKVFKSVE